MIWARDTADGRVKGFLVEKGTPGYRARLIERKASLRAVWQAEIALDGIRVAGRDRLPGRERFADTARVLAATRSSCAWMALGHAVAGFDAALSYAKRRASSARPSRTSRSCRSGWCSMLADVTAMQLYCLQLGRLAERARCDTLAGLAKLHNTSTAREVLAEARDLLGGNGILLDFHVIRHMADIEAIHTYEGTETMQTLIVGPRHHRRQRLHPLVSHLEMAGRVPGPIQARAFVAQREGDQDG